MPTQIVKPRLWTPSINSGFAPRDGLSLNPDLLEGLTGAFVPVMGRTGAMVYDFAKGTTHPYTDNDWVTSRYGPSLLGDDVDNMVEINGVDRGLNDTNECTLFAACSFGSSGSLQAVIDISDNTLTNRGALLFLESPNLDFRCGGDSLRTIASALSTPFEGTIAGTYSARKLQQLLYINGREEASSTLTGNFLRSPLENIRLMRLFQNVHPLDGYLAVALIYNRAKSASQIKRLHEDPLAPFRLRPLSVAFPSAAAPAGLAAYRRVMSVF